MMIEQIVFSVMFGVCIGVGSDSPAYGAAAAIVMSVLQEIKYRLK